MTVTLSAPSGPQLSRVRTFLFGGFAVASIAYAGLVCLVPLRQIVSHAGWNCSTSPVLIPVVLLLVGWVIHAAVGRMRGDL